MNTKWIITLTLALGMAAVPALAGHRHRHGCGHVYSRPHGGWVSVNVITPSFGFSYSRAPRYGRYYDPYGGSRYYGSPYGYRSRGYGYWDPYRYDSRYHHHRGYWKHHHGHHHGYKDRHCR